MVVVDKLTPNFSIIDSVTNPQPHQLSGLSEEVFDGLPIAVFERLLDQSWTVKSISVGITEILGESSMVLFEAKTVNFASFVLAADFPLVNQSIREQLLQTQSYMVEYRLVRRDGQIGWVQEQGKGVYDAENRLIGVRGILFALGQHARREQHLLQERQMLQQLIMDAPVAIAMFDREMCYLAYSYQWLLDFEIEAKHDTLMGCSHYELFPNLPEDWYELHQKALQGEKICRPEDQFTLPSGHVIYLRRSIQPWHNDLGEVGGIIIVNQMVNQLVEAREEAIALAKIKSQFLATMSHELRTPLSGIISIAELLTKTRLTPRQQSLTETLIKSSQHLRLIINDILDFSKLEAEALQLETIHFEFYQELDFITKLLGEEAHKKKIELHTLIDPNIPQTVKGDPLRLRQILTNLVHNAIKFTEVGEVVLRVVILESTAQRLLLKFSVTDTGIGIPPEVKKRLFNAFTQGDVDVSRRYGGTGLGLAICKQLVELMGGRIGLESLLGEGSTFWFTLPLEVLPEAASGKIAPLKFNGQDLSILIVGEQLTNRRLLQYYAGHCQMLCDQAATLTEAMAILGEKSYQVVFVAFEEVRHLLTEFEELQERFPMTQVVMIVHPLDHQVLVHTFPNASWQYLFKPIQISHLFACFQEMMAEEAVDVAAVAKPPVHGLNPLRILVADDAKINRDVVSSQLEYLGYHDVTCVADGVDVLAAIATQTYDLILMDCVMLQMDGYQTTRQIREQFTDTKSEPIIIAMTANALPEERQKCIQAGMNDYLVKPVEITVLRQMLQRWQEPNVSSTPRQRIQKLATEEDTVPIIDFQRLHKLIPEDPQWEMDFLRDYQLASQKYLQGLRHCWMNQEATKLEYYAHQLKGISRMAAVNLVPKIAERIERLAIDSDFGAIAPELDQLAIHLETVHQVIEAHRTQS